MMTFSLKHSVYSVDEVGVHALLHSCWMSVDNGTIFGFVAPMLVIVLVSTKC